MKNHLAIKICALIALCSNPKVYAVYSQNLYQPRDFSNSTQDILLLKSMYCNNKAVSHRNGTLSVAPRYSQSFNIGKKNLGSLPFWSGTNSMTYGQHDGTTDLDQYNFGLGETLAQNGTITLNAKIYQVGSDMLLHFTKNIHERGLYFKINAPIVAMSVKTKLSEIDASYDSEQDPNFAKYPAPAARPESMTEAFQSGAIGTDVAYSSINKPLSLDYGRISSCKMTMVRVDDLKLSLGYKVFVCEDGFLDLGIKVSCPTGNVPDAKYILEPIIGKGGHVGLGAEATGYYHLWESEHFIRYVNLWLQGEVMHLFNGRRPNFRSFDLKQNGPGSKYLMLQHYVPINPAIAPDGSSLRGGSLQHAINLTTMPVITSFAVEGSLAAVFDFHSRNWNAALGAELYGRSKECLSIDMCYRLKTNGANLNDYAVLGRQIDRDAAPAVPVSSTASNTYIYLCEPLATINTSLDRVTVDAPGLNNTPPTDPSSYPTLVTPADYDPTKIVDARVAANRIPLSLSDALDISGAAAPRLLTGKVTGQVGYTFCDHAYSPNLSITGDVEFSNQCGSVNLWSIGAQGSINF